MSKSITISLSDETFEALQRASEREHQPAAEVAALMVVRSLGTPPPSATEAQARENKDRLLSLLRERGLLVDPHEVSPHPLTALLPPRGSAEEAALIDAIGEELSDALDRSGKNITDLIER